LLLTDAACSTRTSTVIEPGMYGCAISNRRWKRRLLPDLKAPLASESAATPIPLSPRCVQNGRWVGRVRVVCGDGSLMVSSGVVPNFRPSVNGFRFTNAFPPEPTIEIDLGPAGRVGLGDASQGVRGGMVFAVAITSKRAVRCLRTTRRRLKASHCLATSPGD